MSLRHHAAAGAIDVRRRPDAEVADRLCARDDEHVRVLEAVRRLPTRQRDCVTLRYFEEYSIDRIADTLGAVGRTP